MIGYAMLYTAAVSVPITLAAFVGARFLRMHGRPERGVWVVALAATLLVPAFMLSRPASPQPEAWVPPIQMEVVGVSEPLAPPAQMPPSLVLPSVDVDARLLGAWAFASLLLAVRWLVSAIRLRRLARSWLSESVDGVRVWLTPELGPAVTGVFRPRVVLPAWVPALPERQRSFVLFHEQEHVRARDPLLIIVAKLTRILTPWNPMTWLLTAGLQRAVELDCDQRVLGRHPDVETYGETLLVVSARGSSRLLAAAAFAGTDVPLRKRILAMTTPPRRMTVTGVLITVVTSVVLVMGLVAVPVPAIQVGAAQAIVAARDVASSLSARQAPSLPDPRVISDPRYGFMRIYLSLDDIRNGRPPVAMIPPSVPRDSVWLVVQRILGDSVRGAVGDPGPALPSDPPPPTTVRPRILNQEEIVRAIAGAYPPELRDRGLGGTVGIQFLVGPSGEIQETRVGQISAYPALDEAALEVAQVYRFSPAYEDDRPLAVWVVHAIDFRPTP